MVDTFGTKPAVVRLNAKRGFALSVPFTIQDQYGEGYDDFAEWVLTIKIASGVGATPFFIMTSDEPSPAGGYIQQVIDPDDSSLNIFDLDLTIADLDGFAMSSGTSPDQYYYEISADGDGFGRWPIFAGDFILEKTL